MKKTSLTKIVLMWALFLMPTLLVHAQDEEVVATAKPTVFVDKISAGSSSDKLTVLNAVATALTQSGRVIVITSDSERASTLSTSTTRRTTSRQDLTWWPSDWPCR